MIAVKLGKLPARRDERTIELPGIFKGRVLPPVPDSFDVDQALGLGIPLPMFANDKWGDCVIAARAHMTLRFEGFEQKSVIAITDRDVLNEYWKEQQPCAPKRLLLAHPDNGLNELDSLKAWRKGWKAAGKPYNIYAFAGINWKIHRQIMASIYLLRGAFAGIALPISAQAQTGAGLVWDVDNTPRGEPGSWGLHAVDLKAYNNTGPIGVTWGALQQMSWAFVDRYFDESYGVVDNRNKFMKNSPVDVAWLDSYLQALSECG
jgi:hypothetical protein